MKWVISILLACLIAGFIYFKFIRKIREPEFIELKDLQVIKIEKEIAEVTAIAVFNNPNDITATLINTQLKAYSNDVRIGDLSQTTITEIPALSRFDLPLRFNLDLRKFGMSQSLSGLIENVLKEEKVIPLKFDGYCRIRLNGQVFTVPVVFEDKLKFKL